MYLITDRDRADRTYDAIVVGSGITGGWAAKELTERGLKTLVLERGPLVQHGTDYTYEHTPPWDLPHRGMGNPEDYEREYPIQSACYAFGEATKNYFVKDAEDPYTHDPEKPFTWIRGYQLGGRSIIWGRQCYRWSDLDFKANAEDGFGVDWPIRYADIASWYDHVEAFAGISGQAERIPHLPDGIFQKPMALNCVEEHLRDALHAQFDDRTLTIGRTAVLTEPLNGRAPCHYCGPCHRGCSGGSYFSSLSATLPAAHKTNNLTLLTDQVVEQVLYDEASGRASGVRVIDAHTHEVTEYRARVIFLCASTLPTTRILLHSTSNRFPNGLGNDSGVLGRYLMDHIFQAGANGQFPQFDHLYHEGIRPNGIYIPRFRNVIKKNADFLRGYGFQGGAERLGWEEGAEMAGFGAEFKAKLRTPGPWHMWLLGFGECLPYEDNYVELDATQRDPWGIPSLKIHCTFRQNEHRMREDMAATAAEILEAAGATNVEPYVDPPRPGLCIHEMGTVRMGRDPETSMLNEHNQCHAVPNVFVTDGACMTSSACQNPSLTYMAITARASAFAAEALQRGDL